MPAADFYDELDADGHIALQVHSGGKTHVRWRDARIREYDPLDSLSVWPALQVFGADPAIATARPDIDPESGNLVNPRPITPKQLVEGLLAVGLAGGAGLPATVIPFLLRGVNLLGIDSVMQPYENRLRAWERIARDLPMDKLEAMIQPAVLSDLPGLGRDILKGQVKGRVVVDVNA